MAGAEEGEGAAGRWPPAAGKAIFEGDVGLLRGRGHCRGQRPEARGQRPEARADHPPLVDVRLTAGESFRITPGTIHYMEALTDCDVLEVSTPELDDVVRLKDRYGREGTSAP